MNHIFTGNVSRLTTALDLRTRMSEKQGHRVAPPLTFVRLRRCHRTKMHNCKQCNCSSSRARTTRPQRPSRRQVPCEKEAPLDPPKLPPRRCRASHHFRSSTTLCVASGHKRHAHRCSYMHDDKDALTACICWCTIAAGGRPRQARFAPSILPPPRESTQGVAHACMRSPYDSVRSRAQSLSHGLAGRRCVGCPCMAIRENGSIADLMHAALIRRSHVNGVSTQTTPHPHHRGDLQKASLISFKCHAVWRARNAYASDGGHRNLLHHQPYNLPPIAKKSTAVLVIRARRTRVPVLPHTAETCGAHSPR